MEANNTCLKPGEMSGSILFTIVPSKHMALNNIVSTSMRRHGVWRRTDVDTPLFKVVSVLGSFQSKKADGRSYGICPEW